MGASEVDGVGAELRGPVQGEGQGAQVGAARHPRGDGAHGRHSRAGVGRAEGRRNSSTSIVRSSIGHPERFPEADGGQQGAQPGNNHISI
eukprot:1058175-Pyramimonas_sp.AAC.1